MKARTVHNPISVVTLRRFGADSELGRALESIRNSAQLRMFLRGYWAASLISDLTFLILLAVFPLSASSSSQIYLAIAVVVIPFFAAALRCMLSPPSYSDITKLADERLGLRERVFTAFEFQGKDPTNYSSLVTSDAEAALRLVNPRSVIDLKWDLVAAVVMLIISLLLVTWRTPEVISSFITHYDNGSQGISIGAPQEIHAVPAPGEKPRPAKIGDAKPGSRNNLTEPHYHSATSESSSAQTPTDKSVQSGSETSSNASTSEPESRSAASNGSTASISGAASPTDGSESPTRGAGVPAHDTSASQSIPHSDKGRGIGPSAHNSATSEEGPRTNPAHSSNPKAGAGSNAEHGKNPDHSGSSQNRSSNQSGSGSPGTSSNLSQKPGSGQNPSNKGSQNGENGSGESQAKSAQNGDPTNGSSGEGSRIDRSPSGDEDRDQSGTGGIGAPNGEPMLHGQRTAKIGAPAAMPKQSGQGYAFHLSKTTQGQTIVDERTGKLQGSEAAASSQVSNETGQSAAQSTNVQHAEQNPQIPAGYRSLIKQYFGTENR